MERDNFPGKADALGLIESLLVLQITEPVLEIVEAYISHKVMPADPAVDALHLALASFHRCDFLATSFGEERIGTMRPRLVSVRFMFLPLRVLVGCSQKGGEGAQAGNYNRVGDGVRAPMKLSDLGFDPWLEAHAAQRLRGEGVIARVSAVDRGSYRIRNEWGEVPAELTGKFSYQMESPVDLPCVGDWVKAQYYDKGTAAVIHEVFPRKTFLRRKTAGANVDFQMIAANIDAAFLVQSCHFDFSPRRLDRYLVMAADGGVEPIIVLTKTDLIPRDELEQKLATVSTAAKARMLALSNVTGSGFDELQQTLCPGRTYCLLGSSGVGKTTLINRLVGREAFETRPVSGTGEGTHTTSRRQLIVLSQGAMLIDTPGMRELGLVGAGDGVAAGFEDIVELSANCRYADCSHEHEPGCAVRAAIESGELSEDRYFSYLKLKKESDYHDMSYQDKRRKDRAFGRFIQSSKKQRKD